MLPHLNAFPNTIVQAGFLTGILTGRTLPIVFSAAALTTNALNPLLKRLFQKWQPRKVAWKRPQDMPATGCGSFPRCTLPSGPRPQGMPSGHAQAVAFAATFWTLWLFDHRPGSMFPVAVVWLLAAAVALSRVTQKCHTLGQILVGGVIGSALGYGSYRLVGYTRA